MSSGFDIEIVGTQERLKKAERKCLWMYWARWVLRGAVAVAAVAAANAALFGKENVQVIVTATAGFTAFIELWDPTASLSARELASTALGGFLDETRLRLADAGRNHDDDRQEALKRLSQLLNDFRGYV